MDRKIVRKLFICEILLTLVLAIVVFFLPVEEIVMGYSTANGVGTTLYESKTIGLIRAILIPILCYIFWNIWLRRTNHKNTEKNQKRWAFDGKMVGLLFIILSPLGCLICIINIVKFLI